MRFSLRASMWRYCLTGNDDPTWPKITTALKFVRANSTLRHCSKVSKNRFPVMQRAQFGQTADS